MRTTITLADDVAAALEKLRRERSVGLSEAVNDLVRAGLAKQRAALRFASRPTTSATGSTSPTSPTRSRRLTGPPPADAPRRQPAPLRSAQGSPTARRRSLMADRPAQRPPARRTAVAEPRRVPAHLHPPPRLPAATRARRRMGTCERLARSAGLLDPLPGPEHARILGELITTYEIRGNLVPDAQLAALAIEHGLTLCSTDTDFARFTQTCAG